MSVVQQVVDVVARQAYQTVAATSEAAAAAASKPACSTGNDFDGRIGVRISAIFVILVGSSFGKPGREISPSCLD